ncbi:MAG: VWA domain-containing protein [Trueperaceae bacterium]
MSFEWPLFLWLLLLVPALLVFLRVVGKRRERTAEKFADQRLLGTILRQPSRAQRRLPLMLQLIALTALLFAGSRPIANIPIPQNQAAVIIALDASRSMLADDLDPTRLEQARELAKQFIADAPRSTKIGLTSFSDVASVLVVPTTNRQELLDALDRIEPAENTSLSAAVVAGVRMLPGREGVLPPEDLEPEGFTPLETEESENEEPTATQTPPPGSILILSDGVTNVNSNPDLENEDALEVAAEFAKENTVKLYAVPIGEEDTVTRIDGQEYLIPFEPDNLEILADDTDGQMLEADDEETLRTVFRDLTTAIRWEGKEIELSAPLSAFALLLMAIGGLLSLRWQRRVP